MLPPPELVPRVQVPPAVQQQQVCHPRAQRCPTALSAFGILGMGPTRGAGGFPQLYPSGPPSTARSVVPPKCPRHREGAAAAVQLQEDCRLALFP